MTPPGLVHFPQSHRFRPTLFTPTLYAVLQEFGTRLLPLLSEGNQGERFIEGQLAEEAVGGVNVLSNLEKTKTRDRQGRLLSTVACIPPNTKVAMHQEKCPVNRSGSF